MGSPRERTGARQTPSIAGVCDYLLGGKDNFAADREIMELVPPGLVEARRWHRAGRSSLRCRPAPARPSLA
jgi:hypothetical protein